jgi:hypothetical protein
MDPYEEVDPSIPLQYAEMNPSLPLQYAALVKHRRALEAQLTALKQQIDQLKPMILEMFLQLRTQNMTVGGRTLYLSRELWANVGEAGPEALNAVLREQGLGDLISESVHHTRLKEYVREQVQQYVDKNGDELLSLEELLSRALPAALLAVLRVGVKTDVRDVAARQARRKGIGTMTEASVDLEADVP